MRHCLNEATIYCLDGLLPGTAHLFAKNNLQPVLGSMAEIEEWGGYCRNAEMNLSAAIHIDTGMQRLGLPPDEVRTLKQQENIFDAFKVSLVMSHLACADEPNVDFNKKQVELFQKLRNAFPGIPASLANSAGILLGTEYHFDCARPGIALYGGRPFASGSNPMAPVISLHTPILQIRHVVAGTPVGYSAQHIVTRDTRIATLPVGYADGYFRMLGASSEKKGAIAYINGRAAPLIGRVSMDLITIDITDFPDGAVARGDRVELIGSNITVDDLAQLAQTLSYEVLTSLGHRYHRLYIDEAG